MTSDRDPTECSTMGEKVIWCWKESAHRIVFHEHKPETIWGDPKDYWIRYPTQSSRQIERAFQEQWGFGQKLLTGSAYLVDFFKMEQVNTYTGFRRPVQRVVLDQLVKDREHLGLCGTCGEELSHKHDAFRKRTIRCLGCYPFTDRDDELSIDALCRGDEALLHKIPREIKDKKTVVSRAISKNGLSLAYVTDRWKDDEDVVKQAIKQDGRALQHASPRLCNTPETVRTAISNSAAAMLFSSDTLQNDFDFVLEAVESNPNVLEFALSEFSDDSDIVKCAVLKNAAVLVHASDRIKNDDEFLRWLEEHASKTEQEKGQPPIANRKHRHLLPTRDGVPKYLQDDRDFVLEQVKNDGNLLSYASDRLSNDVEIVESAIAIDPMSLAHASLNRRDHKELVLRAVAHNGNAFRYASKRLRGDKEVALAAISTQPTFIARCSPELREDRELVLAAVKHEGRILGNYSHSFKFMDDIDIVFAAVSNHGDALRFASERLRSDKSVVLASVAQDATAIRHASSELRGDKECVLAAVRGKPEALKYALAGLNQDRDCLIEAGLWDESYTSNNSGKGEEGGNPVSSLICKTSSRIVLSTRFSLEEESSPTATEFTVLLKDHRHIRREKDWTIHSPNAFMKNTCDPDWTDKEWPCRGTLETCQKANFNPDSGVPTLASCWRYSYRYQLMIAKDTGGFMLQVVELGNSGNHQLGKGQEIEVLMANGVGTKIFRVYEPFLQLGPGLRYRRKFRSSDIDALISEVRQWYEKCPSDMSMVEIHCSVSTRTGKFTKLRVPKARQKAQKHS